MFRLGICYEHGAGVPQDMVKAYTWFRKAASYGHEDALRYLSSLPTRQAVVFNAPINHHAGERISHSPA